MVGLVLVGCGGGGEQSEAAITAPVVCVDDGAGQITATFLVPGKNLAEMMANTFIEQCVQASCNKITADIGFSTSGLATAYCGATSDITTTTAEETNTWVYQP